MIKKLKNKIFLLVFVSLSIIILGVISIFAFLNYHNTINTAVMMIDRMSKMGLPRELERTPGKELEKNNQSIDGIYNIRIDNNTVLEDIQIDSKIRDYAVEATKRKSESGIIGNYIYNVKKRGRNTCDVILMENEDAISRANSILVVSIIIGIVSIIIIYIGSKKLSKIIVKPVETTFEKQKQFISDASHELKTPLAVIEANTDVIENELPNNKWIKYIQNEIDSMNKLINELLTLAKIENIDSLRELQEINLSEELEIIISMFESMAYEKDVILESNIKENIKMKANKEDIEHIVSTLLDNAIKHTDAKNKVIIELDKEKNNIAIQVKNCGEPIPEEERKKIFERFYRIDKSRNRSEKRYGLGLAIAKSTVQKYKGKIEVLYKDNFTIFKVIIPV